MNRSRCAITLSCISIAACQAAAASSEDNITGGTPFEGDVTVEAEVVFAPDTGSKIIGTNPYSDYVDFGDLNGDGTADLVSRRLDGSLWVLSGDATTNLATSMRNSAREVAPKVSSFVVLDHDGDGLSDIAFSSFDPDDSNGTWNIYLLNGPLSGDVSPVRVEAGLELDSSGGQLQKADVDGDAKDDLLVTSNLRASFLRGTSTGFSQAEALSPEFLIPGLGKVAPLGDLNHDGTTDFATVSGNPDEAPCNLSITVLGKTTPWDHTTWGCRNNFRSVVLGDGDGDDEVLFAQYSDEKEALVSLGSDVELYNVPSRSADFDLDGKMDVVQKNDVFLTGETHHLNLLYRPLGQYPSPSAKLTITHQGTPIGSFQLLGVPDLDGDARADLVLFGVDGFYVIPSRT